MLVTLPGWVVLGLATDALRGGRSAITRSLLFFTWYLVCESLGLLACLLLWPLRPLAGAARYTAWHFSLEGRWAAALLLGARRIFGVRIEVERFDALGDGPILLFVRHASTADTILAAVLLQRAEGWRLRYVLKRELLWDPCLDVVGHRVPNYFADRSATNTELELAGVRRLAEALGAGDGVLIYPEGTRFSEAKRARILSRIESQGDPARLAHARALRYTLPPRHGGPLALLAACPEADVAVLVHHGFEGTADFGSFIAGGLVDARVDVALWRVPRAEIPGDPAGQRAWLDALWLRVDGWLAARQASDRDAQQGDGDEAGVGELDSVPGAPRGLAVPRSQGAGK